ncbi:MAG: hypothetical protein JO023_09695 [Chloroflexi bacterium]|nr:hypothetical protein [Chloroflexota bacterium]
MSLPDNEYLRAFRAEPDATATYHAWLRRPAGSAYERRRAQVRRFAFAVPTEPALTIIGRFAPIVELGAGTGYWAYLLRQRGVDVVAYDRFPPDRADNPNRLEPRLWTEVLEGDEQVLGRYPDRSLLLCWPSWRDPFAAAALEVYTGATLLYIGEAAGGHTADDRFFERLDRDWQAEASVDLPHWPGTSDRLTVFTRRPAAPATIRVCTSKRAIGSSASASSAATRRSG